MSKEHHSFESNFNQFVRELEKLSRKYGVWLCATGGIGIYRPYAPFTYICDYSSGDLDYTEVSHV